MNTLERTAKQIDLELKTNDHQFTHSRISLGYSKNSRFNLKLSIIPVQITPSGFNFQPLGDWTWKNLPLGTIERYSNKALQPYIGKLESSLETKSGDIGISLTGRCKSINFN